MQLWKQITIDDPALWPKSTRVPLDNPHTDLRGYIQSLVNFPVKNISIIHSKKGTLRSNHYHKTDWHYMYVLSGAAIYYCRPTTSAKRPKKVSLQKGDLIFTPPLEDHTTVFLEDTELLVMSRNPRDQDSYESDVVRIEMINPKTLLVR
jgi:oxalate decarboxylase/phosphoglucose isomerase-like protein (cupin superfamily)